jgi:RNA polymerase-binding transcription factor DksA
MTDEQRQTIEQRLLEERDRAGDRLRRHQESIASSDDDGDLTLYPLHLADEGTDTIEQEKSLMLGSRDGEYLQTLDEALRRLYEDPANFGRCENCQSEIAFERLEMVPWTRYCLNCMTAQDAPA